MMSVHQRFGMVALAAAASAGVALAAPAQCEADLTGDGVTDVFDFGALVAAFGTSAGDSGFDPAADIVPDGVIDVFDFSELATDFGCETRTIRVMTFNIEDRSTLQVTSGINVGLKRAAEIIQIVRPDIVLINEIEYDEPGDVPGEPEGQNGQRFADLYLAVSQGGQTPIDYTAYMMPSNTGIHSGFDLNNDGINDPSSTGSTYGEDCFGFGFRPGQFAMALLVRDGADLEILADQARTFQFFLWKDMPGFLQVTDPLAGGAAWYSPAELDVLRLSSKSHWDVPVRLPDGSTLHLLASHPTPPVFDGPEDRNGKRNHDEIRFWADYVLDQPYFYDDEGVVGGLPLTAPFVILGDLNADPVDGDSFDNPIANLIQPNPRINFLSPVGDIAVPGYDPTDTAFFGLRADYCLPSVDLVITGTQVEREAGPYDETNWPSDHWPVWIDIRVGTR